MPGLLVPALSLLQQPDEHLRHLAWVKCEGKVHPTRSPKVGVHVGVLDGRSSKIP